MGLVDRQQADLGAPQQRDGVGLGEPLGRDIGEAQRAAFDLIENAPVLASIVARVQARRPRTP